MDRRHRLHLRLALIRLTWRPTLVHPDWLTVWLMWPPRCLTLTIPRQILAVMVLHLPILLGYRTPKLEN
ncbi:MAG: hypothetical protein EXR77_18295 [Myxococcales bacterium]|nr:hypothetical protein [Myxococcales bacterium]